MNKIWKVFLGVAVLSCGYSGAASAGNLYAGVALGQATVESGQKNNTDSAINSLGATGLSSTLDRNDTGAKLQVGYKLSPYFSLEAGWVNLGKNKYRSSYAISGTSLTTNVTGKASGWTISGVGTLPINEKFALFARVGAINAKLSADTTAASATASASTSASQTKWRNVWGLGAKYSLTKSIDVQLEYERYFFGYAADTDLISAGLVYNF